MSEIQTASKRRPRARKQTFKVGDRIQLTYMSNLVPGRIVEDRGALGVGGRQLYRIVIQAGSVERVLELPGDEIERIPVPVVG